MTKSVSKHAKLQESDRISSLPDPMLHHILSFLPTKEAVATSLILSKRWKPLGLAMPALDIHDSVFSCLNSLIQFVDAVLLLSDSKPINVFRLNCLRFKIPSIRINLWIKAVVNRKVLEHLELCFADLNSHIEVPASIFHNSRIRVLKLAGVILNVRSPVSLPSLKVMHLVNVQLSSRESEANILNGCSVLEELVLKCIKYVKFLLPKNFKIGRCEHLVSAEVRPYCICLTAFSNVKFFRVETLWLPDIQSFPTFDNLTDLEVSCMCANNHYLNHVVKCLQRFPKLEVLAIHKLHPDIGSNERSMKAMLEVPQCISSNLKKFHLGAYRGLEVQFQFASFIMENASNLKSISIRSSSKGTADSKLQMLRRLSSCTRASMNCRLLFN